MAFWVSLVIVAALLATLRRVMPFRIMFGYAVWIDLLFTMTMVNMFIGTFVGLFAAVLAGLILTVVLWIGKLVIGYERLALRRQDGRLRVEVTRYPGWLDTASAGLSEALRGRWNNLRARHQERQQAWNI